MDATTVSNLANTSVVGGGGGPGLLDIIGGFAQQYGSAYINNRFDNTKDTALAEQKAGLNAQIAISSQQTKAIVIGAAVLLAAVVLYKVL